MPTLPLPGPEFALLPLWGISVTWLHLPVLLVIVSLVYGATRFDDWPSILRESVRWVVRLFAFLVVIVVILYVLATSIG
jgi:hypothetical protein